jgi:7-keto-8-aminopelargonate synthetase-like enzyme
LLDETAKVLAARGLIHLTAQDQRFDGRHVTLRGQRLVDFGSCSYLGLEVDERLKQAACDAIQRYGVLGFAKMRARTVVALGLSKAFAAAGAAFVFSDEETRRLGRSCGSALIFSGPLQPGQLIAGIASARLHLTGAISAPQSVLRARIELFNELCESLGLRLRNYAESPVRFFEVGEERAVELGSSLAEKLVFFTNFSVLPAVPRRRAGIRVMLTHATPKKTSCVSCARSLTGAVAHCVELARFADFLSAPLRSSARPVYSLVYEGLRGSGCRPEDPV